MPNLVTLLRLAWLVLAVALMAPRVKAQYTIVDVDSPMVFALCYEDMLDTGITFVCTNGQDVYLQICMGQLEACCDQLYLYDGGDTLAPVLFSGNGTGDVTGVIAVSTGDSLTCRITSNDTINCWTVPYLPIVWSVGCGQGYPCTIGMQELETPPALELFPVPATYELQVRTDRPWTAPWVLEVVDPTGRVVLTQRASGAALEQGQVDVSSFGSGSYLLRLRNANGVRSARFVIAR